MAQERQLAVSVRGAYKTYGTGERRIEVLKNLNMTVPRGTIYGLLGASGSGKTTLLTSLSGLRPLDSGEITVLGSPPSSGPTVGYMPQDISLMGDFSISDTFFFFGRIMGMSSDEIRDRLIVLTNLLELPPKHRYVGTLSGGQQRRVSLSVALLHDPELLILDEPTVGLDPILRHRIWDYLVEMTRSHSKTVILTTHYIEEARQSDLVGLMRGGVLLAEAPPEALLSMHECSSLEQLFLLLSERQQTNMERGIESSAIEATVVPASEFATIDKDKQKRKAKRFSVMRSLLTRNYLRFVRNPGSMIFSLGFVIIQITLFFFAIGTPPVDLHLAVVNHEAFNKPCDYSIDVPHCDAARLSCRFLASMNNKTIKQVSYADLSTAEDEVRAGRAWGVIHFTTNFSDSIRERDRLGKDTSDDVLEASEIAIKLDMSDGHIAGALQQELYKTFENFFEEYLLSCDVDVKHGKIPLHMNEPIYGDNNYSYQIAVAPGTLLTILYFLGISLSSFAVLADKNEGTWDRTIVSGAMSGELLASHAIWQAFVVGAQTFEAMVLTFLIFNLQNHGSFVLTALMMYLEGLCGMLYGLLISVVCTEVRTADILSMGSLIPMFMICGVIWPVEGIPSPLREATELLPLTSGNIALSSVMGRGLGIDRSEVYSGYITVILWCIAAIALCMLKFIVSKN